MNWIAFGASAVTAICALIGTYVSNKKTTALIEYRLKMLEDKVGRHNSLESRIVNLENDIRWLKNELKAS